MRIAIRFFQSTNKKFFLFGPRGSGKSTLIKRYSFTWLGFFNLLRTIPWVLELIQGFMLSGMLHKLKKYLPT